MWGGPGKDGNSNRETREEEGILHEAGQTGLGLGLHNMGLFVGYDRRKAKLANLPSVCSECSSTLNDRSQAPGQYLNEYLLLG